MAKKADTKKAGAKKAATRKQEPKKVAVKKGRAKAALPVPATLPAVKAKAPKAVKRAESRHLRSLDIHPPGEPAVLDRLWQTVEQRRASGDTANSHSARLIARGTPKVAQKLGEEAVECVIEATLGNRRETILESADLLYHLVVVWVDAGIHPGEVWSELTRREGVSGIIEKASRPKGILQAAQTTKLP